MSVVISLCDLTGAMVEPWVEAGHCRSATPRGFARAVFEANARRVMAA